MSEEEKGRFCGHHPCINEECGSSDAMAVYEKEDGSHDAYCWSCKTKFSSEELDVSNLEIETFVPVKREKRASITEDEIREINTTTVYDTTGYRGINEETNRFYKIRSKIIGGQVLERHYPVTKDSRPSAFKKRVHPKQFNKGYKGYNGYDCDLFGQCRFSKGGKYLLIAAGEEDTAAAYQMLWDDQKKRGKDNYEPVAVVSSTIGEGGIKQIKHNFEWVTSFQKIIICMDKDDAGQKALKEILNVLPVGKTFVMDCPAKDANECLQTGFAVKFVRAFYNAAEHNPSGIIGSSSLIQKVIEYAKTPRLGLPHFLFRMEEMMAGGIPLGTIVNMASASGTGKSTLVNEVLYHWIFKSPYRLSITPLEGGSDYFAESLLSRHLGKKIALISDPQQKVDYLTEPAIVQKTDELFMTKAGLDRFEVLDGEGSLDLQIFKERAEHMVRAMGVKVLIIDPLTKLLEGEEFSETQKFMKWENDFVIRNKCIIINIVQVRKSGSGKKANSTGADLHEEDMSGAGAILQTGFCNILFMRNKEAEDEEVRNTTKMMMSKCRWSGMTGPAGFIYYDNKSHTIHDRDMYFANKSIDDFAEEEDMFRGEGAFETPEKEEFSEF